MSSATLVSVQEYLATSYRPDRDFVDGELQERNLGELEHALLQTAIAAWFWNKQKEWNVLPIVEQRVQVAPTRFRSTRCQRPVSRSTTRADRHYTSADPDRGSLQRRFPPWHEGTS